MRACRVDEWGWIQPTYSEAKTQRSRLLHLQQVLPFSSVTLQVLETRPAVSAALVQASLCIHLHLLPERYWRCQRIACGRARRSISNANGRRPGRTWTPKLRRPTARNLCVEGRYASSTSGYFVHTDLSSSAASFLWRSQSLPAPLPLYSRGSNWKACVDVLYVSPSRHAASYSDVFL